MTLENNQNQIKFNEIEYLNKELLHSSILNENTKLNPNLEVTDILNSKHKLGDILNGAKEKLIIRNSETGCGFCIENELRIIKKHQKKIGLKNIILLTTHDSARKLEIFKKSNKIDFEVFSCPKLNTEFDIASVKPYIFVSDSNLALRNFFIPDTSFEYRSDSYYTTIQKRYFNY